MRQPAGLRLVLALTLAVLTGCGGGGLDERNVSRVKIGMTSQEVEAILGKGGKAITSDEVTALLREALTPKEGLSAKGAKLEPDTSGARGVRWGDDSKSVTVIFTSDRASRVFKKGF
jgi:hypothetical protein